MVRLSINQSSHLLVGLSASMADISMDARHLSTLGQ